MRATAASSVILCYVINLAGKHSLVLLNTLLLHAHCKKFTRFGVCILGFNKVVFTSYVELHSASQCVFLPKTNNGISGGMIGTLTAVETTRLRADSSAFAFFLFFQERRPKCPLFNLMRWH